jgi:pSer/pThr/pTyr-binding forkhead associated (FHA) protein
MIEDLHSTNGTRVNNVAIEQETPVEPGDQIDLGGVILVVELPEPANPGEL